MTVRHLILLSLIFTVSAQFSWAQSRNQLIKDSQRQQVLKKSAAEWFEREVYPYLRQQVHSINGYGVSIKEPQVTLPPSLGGPLNHVQVTVKVQFSGLVERTYNHPRYYGLPDYGAANCRFEQKLWADIDKSTGKPIRIRRGQRAQLLFACASPGVEWPNEKRRNY